MVRAGAAVSWGGVQAVGPHPQVAGMRGACLVALDVPVLALRWRRLPRDLQLAGRERVHLHVLRGLGGGCGAESRGSAEQPAHPRGLPGPAPARMTTDPSQNHGSKCIQ